MNMRTNINVNHSSRAGRQLAVLAAMAAATACSPSTLSQALKHPQATNVLNLGVAEDSWGKPKGSKLRRVPHDIGRLTELRALYLDGNDLSELPPEFGQLTKLEFLDLRNNRLRDLPTEVRSLEDLRVLYLSGNPLNDGVLEKLQELLPRTDVVFLTADVYQRRQPRPLTAEQHEIVAKLLLDCSDGDDETCWQVGSFLEDVGETERAFRTFAVSCARHAPGETGDESRRSPSLTACLSAGHLVAGLYARMDPRRELASLSYYEYGCQNGDQSACSNAEGSRDHLRTLDRMAAESRVAQRAFWTGLTSQLDASLRHLSRSMADGQAMTTSAQQGSIYVPGVSPRPVNKNEPQGPQGSRTSRVLRDAAAFAASLSDAMNPEGAGSSERVPDVEQPPGSAGQSASSCEQDYVHAQGRCIRRSDRLRLDASLGALKDGCGSGDVGDCYVLALRWQPRSPREAVRILEVACRWGFGTACSVAARDLIVGVLVPRDERRAAHLSKTAYETLEATCRAGVAVDCIEAARLHKQWRPRSYERDELEVQWLALALERLMPACEGGNPTACSAAANAARERGDRGKEWEALLRACDLDAALCGPLGSLLYDPSREPQVESAFRSACQKGHCVPLAMLLLHKNTDKARRLLESSCSKGSRAACSHRKALELEDACRNPRSEGCATAFYFRTECEWGDAESCVDTASAVEMRETTEDAIKAITQGRDIDLLEEALTFYERGCTAGHPKGCRAAEGIRRDILVARLRRGQR